MTERASRPLLDLDPTRAPAIPVDAATLVLLRDGDAGLEVFCVQRTIGTQFMGGAVVFPGGKVDAGDHDAAWRPLVTALPSRLEELGDGRLSQELAVAACRESLEEAAILPVTGALNHEGVLALRETLSSGVGALREALASASLRLDLQALVPFARWVTPAAERRRFDTRFFMLRAPRAQVGAHDSKETTSSFWSTPADVLARWDNGDIQLAPPTHHTLWTLTRASSVDDALGAASRRSLRAIRPELVTVGHTSALVLPGDPAHSDSQAIIEGPSRYVLHADHWRPENARLSG